MNDPSTLVERGYDAIAKRYLEWVRDVRVGERSRYERVVLDGLPAGARVVDLGCGVGRPTTARLAERFEVVGVDASGEALRLARRDVPDVEFVHSDMTSVAFGDESVDGVAAFYSVIHVPRDRHEDLLRNIFGWLRPGGLFVATMGARDTEAGYEEDWLGVPMFWSFFDAAHNEALVRGVGFDIVDADLLTEVEEENGAPVSFLWVVCRKPETRR